MVLPQTYWWRPHFHHHKHFDAIRQILHVGFVSRMSWLLPTVTEGLHELGAVKTNVKSNFFHWSQINESYLSNNEYYCSIITNLVYKTSGFSFQLKLLMNCTITQNAVSSERLHRVFVKYSITTFSGKLTQCDIIFRNGIFSYDVSLFFAYEIFHCTNTPQI